MTTPRRFGGFRSLGGDRLPDTILPFALEVDYGQTIRKVAIAPTFHRHNFIDRKHHKLDFEFLGFEVIQEEKELYFTLHTTDKVQFSRLRIPYPEEYITDVAGAGGWLFQITQTSGVGAVLCCATTNGGWLATSFLCELSPSAVSIINPSPLH